MISGKEECAVLKAKHGGRRRRRSTRYSRSELVNLVRRNRKRRRKRGKGKGPRRREKKKKKKKKKKKEEIEGFAGLCGKGRNSTPWDAY